jgi:hypothetical protein
MAWTGNDGPRRSRDEMYAHVVARGTTLRRRRRSAMATLAGMVAVVLVLAATLVGHHGRSTVVSATAGDTTSTSVASTSTSTVGLPSTTTTAVPASLPVGVAPTTLAPAPTTIPKTTLSTAAQATTTIPVDQPACDTDYLVITITLDHQGSPPSYQPGQDVNATATLRNNGPGTCYVGGGGTNSYMFQNAAGQGVGVGGEGISDPVGNANFPIAAGAVYRTQTAKWNQDCPNLQCAPGTYSVIFDWGLLDPTPASIPPGTDNGGVFHVIATASFQLVAA